MGPLLCELHAHTSWSDGDLTIQELVDLHGRSGFDVLCVTDHVIRSGDPWRERQPGLASWVDEEQLGSVLLEIEREAARSWRTYGMLVVPGLELTFNDEDPGQAAHAVAVGLREFISVDDGIAEAMSAAAEAGAAIIAAHPYGASRDPSGESTADGTPPPNDSRLTQRFYRDEELRGLAHRFELFNRSQLFGWVADAGLPAVATGDVHRAEHAFGWKTLLPTRHEESAVVEYLRSSRPVYLARLDAETSRAAA